MVDAVMGPYAQFSDFPVKDAVKAALAEMGYQTPTEVQAQVVDPGVQGRDLLVQSKTGSGKTTAFGIPLMQRLEAGSAAAHHPRALVLAPTRELAHQVAQELMALGRTQSMRIAAFYGGVPMGKQTAQLEAGVDIVVGTPGRLLDHIRRGALKLSELQVIVLDEADEMLSMGFWDDVMEMIRLTPKTRQTLLFSATLPYEVARSAANLLEDPVRLNISGDDLSVSGIDNCILHVLPDVSKPRQLLYLLEGENAQSAIIFCNTRAETDMLAKYLTQSGFVAEPLSGSFSQKDRDRTMARIKSGELRYMVATDIAARGIDINDLSHVFNYALPEFCEVYLHRVGRTGRIGKIGKAISLVDGRGLGTLSVLEREFGVKFIEMTLPPEEEVIRARSQRIMKELAEKAAMAELGQHLNVAQDILGKDDATKVVAFLLKAYFNGQAGGDSRSPARISAATAAAAAIAESEPARASAPEAEGEAQDGEQAEGKTRRRRRGRGKTQEAQDGAPAPEAAEQKEASAPVAAKSAPKPAPSAEPEDDEAQEAAPAPGRNAPKSAVPFEIIDAVDLLFPERRQAAQAARAAQEAARKESMAEPGNRAPRPPRAEGRGRQPDRERERPERERPGRGPRPERQAAPRSAPKQPQHPAHSEPLPEGMARIRVNIGFDDGFKGRGAVAKKIAALAGLNEGTVTELESRRDHAVLRANHEIAEMVVDRVDGAALGKKIITVSLLDAASNQQG